MAIIKRIKLDIGDVPHFVNQTLAVSQDINLTQDTNNYTVSGKSLMGILALDLNESMNMIIHDTDDESVCKIFSKWFV